MIFRFFSFYFANPDIVYAVEASDMADMAEKLIEANDWQDVIKVIKGKIEDIELPEKVDVIVSEPIGFLLVHERMLESYILAREKFLNVKTDKTQQMYPARGTIRALPFTDWQLYHELISKSHFWKMQQFFGVDLTALEGHALSQLFSQPVIGYFDPSQLIADERDIASHEVDFRTASVADDLAYIEMKFRYRITKTSLMHGLGCWFDVDFLGSQNTVVLTTSPKAPGTHWYQIRLLLSQPLAVNVGQYVSGVLKMKVNSKFSYDLTLQAEVEGTREPINSINHIALHDPYYHYLNTPTSNQGPNWETHNAHYGTNFGNTQGSHLGSTEVDESVSSENE